MASERSTSERSTSERGNSLGRWGLGRWMVPVAGVAMGLTLLGVSIGSSRPTEDPPSLLKHVVLFQFKGESTEEQKKGVVDAFRQLPSKIREVASFEYGTDVSPEKLADGFTHCFLMSFKTEKDRDVYLVHEAHQEFVKVALPQVQKVLVVDYWSGK